VPAVRIVYHVSGSFVDMLPDKIGELGIQNEIHLVLEMSPRLWSINALGLPIASETPALVECRRWLLSLLPSALHGSLSRLASVHAAVFPAALGPESPRIAAACARLVRRIHPDVVHLDGETFRSLLWLPLAGAPLVLSIHEPWLPRGAGQAEVRLAMRLLRTRASVLIVHSKEARRELMRMAHPHATPILVAPFGSISSFPEFLPLGARLEGQVRSVLFAGRLTPRKGVDTFVSAARVAATKVREVNFVVRGMPVRGVVPPESQRLPGECSLVVDGSRQPPGILALAFRDAEFVVTPYRDARQSGVILTAFGFEKPVIATRVGGLVEQVRDGKTGVLVPPGEPELLAQAMVELLNDREKQARMSLSIRRDNQKRLSWRRFGLATQDAYRLAGREPRGRAAATGAGPVDTLAEYGRADGRP
jgi:glycosyltransferase involved in cell wall biosynthesis